MFYFILGDIQSENNDIKLVVEIGLMVTGAIVLSLIGGIKTQGV